MEKSLQLRRATRQLFRFALLITLLTGLIGASGGSVSALPLPPGGESNIITRADGLTITWEIPPARLSTNAQGMLEVDIPGLEKGAVAGQPQLPVKYLLVALPPGGAPVVRIASQSSRVEPLSAPLALAPQASKAPIVDESQPAEQKAILPAQLEEVGIMRGVRLARLALRPVVAQGGQLVVYSQLRVEVDFGSAAAPTPVEGDAMLEQVAASVVNPSQVQSTLKETQLSAGIPAEAQAVTTKWAAQIEQAGLYTVSYEELQQAGFSGGAIYVTHAGQEVAVELTGDGDALLEAGETLRFYAQPRVQRWSSYDTYFFSTDKGATLMASRSVTPSGAGAGVIEAEKLFEQNLFYPYLDPIYNTPEAGRDGDRWMWEQFVFGDSRDFFFDLGNVNPSLAASITVYMNGKTSGTNIVTVKIKGTTIGTVTWTGRTAKSQTISIPTGLLADTGNKLTLSLGGSVAGFWLDAFSVRYKTDTNPLSGESAFFGQASGTYTYTAYLTSPDTALLYDTTVPHAPARLTGATSSAAANTLTLQDTSSGTPRAYLATNTLRSLTYPENLRVSPAMQTSAPDAATYLVIAHPAFLSGTAPLVAHRQSKGQVVKVENAQAIYDKYGEGLPTPQAIKAFLQEAYNTWSTRPQYVLLVGDGTFDPKHYQNASPTFIPPYLQMISQGEYAADNRYVTMDGVDDILPDMMIGRLPVNDAAQLADITNKIINYENNPPAGDWRQHGTVIADYPLYGDYDFVLVSDALYDKMRSTPLLKQKIYYKVNYLTGDAANTAILQAWNAGTAIITFSGHASWHQWGGRTYDPVSNEILFQYHADPAISDLDDLVNGYKLPAVLEFTCETSRFDTPGFDTLDELLVRKSNGGAIFTFGPSSPGSGGSQKMLGQGFIGNLPGGTATAGTAMNAAKLYLYQNDPTYYLVDTYLVLGDPAVRIQVETTALNQKSYLPAVKK